MEPTANKYYRRKSDTFGVVPQKTVFKQVRLEKCLEIMMFCGGYLLASCSTNFRDLQATWLNEARDSVQDRFKRSSIGGLYGRQLDLARNNYPEGQVGERNEQACNQQRSQHFENYMQSCDTNFLGSGDNETQGEYKGVP